MYRAPLTASLTLLLLVSTPARAALVGNIFSGPTTGDPASLYWNPGAMTLMQGTHGMGFGAISFIRLHHQRDTVSDYTQKQYPEAEVFVPKPALALGVVTDATLRDFRFGLGVSLPILDGAGWSEEYGGQAASTRYFALNARLGFIKIAPAVAYRISRHIAVGFGLDIEGVMLTHEVMTDFGGKINAMACSINKTADCHNGPLLPRENPDYDAMTTIDGFGWGVGIFAGVLITPTSRLQVGVGFHSGAGGVSIPVDMEIQLPSSVISFHKDNMSLLKLPELKATGEVVAHSPMTVAVGIAVRPITNLEIAADLHWTDFSETAVMLGNISWSSSTLIGNQVLIKVRDDAFLTGIRGTYRLFPWLKLAARFEYENNTRPEKYVTPVSVDFHKFSFHVGASLRPFPWLSVNVEYGHYILPERNIKTSRFAPNALPTTPEEEGLDKASPTGRYWIAVDRVGLGATVSF